MDGRLTAGIFIGLSILIMVFLFFSPFLIGRQGFQQVMMPIYSIHDFLCRFISEPRTTAFHSTVHILHFLSNACEISKQWLGRAYARNLRPHLRTSEAPLLPLHEIPLQRMFSQGHSSSPTSGPGASQSFTHLPFDIRIIVYRQYLRLFSRTCWHITNTLRADPNFLSAMAFIRTCRLVREELGPLMFQSLQFETDTKYPFFRNMSTSLTSKIRNLSLHFRPSTEVDFIHATLIQQLHHMKALYKVAITVADKVPVDLDRELEHILCRFKMAHTSLKSLTVMTSMTFATATADLVLTQAMNRLVTILLPLFGPHPAFRASVWAKDMGKGRFRPATGWFCRVAPGDDPDWEEGPDEAA